MLLDHFFYKACEEMVFAKQKRNQNKLFNFSENFIDFFESEHLSIDLKASRTFENLPNLQFF